MRVQVHTQYIDLQYVPTANTKILATAQFMEAASSTKCIFGVQNSSTRGIVWAGARNTNFLGQLDFSTEVTISTFDQQKHTHVFDCAEKTYTFAGGSPITLSSSFITPTYSLYLFAHRNGSLTQLLTKLRVYDFAIYEGPTEVHHLIPARRDSDNVICMVDIVTGQAYLNAGSGEFVSP